MRSQVRDKRKQSPLAGARSPSTILGIDPGSLCCGYGIIRVGSRGTEYLASGRLLLKEGLLHERLRELYIGLKVVIREYKPSEAVIEKIFFSKSASSALLLGHVRGVVLLSVAEEGIPFYEYTAVEVKKAITGYGRAEKRQVAEMVKRILNTKVALSPDSADALALAVCRSHRAWLRSQTP